MTDLSDSELWAHCFALGEAQPEDATEMVRSLNADPSQVAFEICGTSNSPSVKTWTLKQLAKAVQASHGQPSKLSDASMVQQWARLAGKRFTYKTTSDMESYWVVQ